MKNKYLVLPFIIAMSTTLCSCTFSHRNVKEVVVELADDDQKRIGDTISLDDFNIYFNYGSGLELLDAKDLYSKNIKGVLKSPNLKYTTLSIVKVESQG